MIRIYRNASFREEDHPRGEDGKFGKGSGEEKGSDKKEKKTTAKPSDQFSDFIKQQINVNLSDRIEESSRRGVVSLYIKGLDRNVLADISRFSRQYKKYKVSDGGAGRLSIIFPTSKFWDSTSFNWTPGF